MKSEKDAIYALRQRNSAIIASTAVLGYLILFTNFFKQFGIGGHYATSDRKSMVPDKDADSDDNPGLEETNNEDYYQY